jgi:hypothetical protein
LLNHDDVKIIGNFDLLPHQPAGFMISHLVRAGALAIICANSTPSTASARNIYDGQWNVLIVTQMGSCDPASRYSLQIVNGNVVDGSGIATLSGRVAPNGSVHVAVSSGGSLASGSGRLSQWVGRGSWAGRSGPDICSGYWTAERRS